MPSHNPLRVAIDQRLAAYRGGGIARYAVELTAALRKFTDIEPLAVCSARDRVAVAGSIRLRTPPHHRLEEWALGVEMLLKGRVVTLYHATDFIAPRLLRTPVVATVHDLAFLRRPDDLAPDALSYYRRIYGSRRWTDHWIVPSRWTAGELAGLLGVHSESISVVQHGVTSFLQRGAPLERDQRGGFLLTVGTVEPRKRYDLLLDAMACMAARPKLKVVGGSGWRSDEVERRLRATPGVEWLEGVDDGELERLYREATAVIVPSRAEGFGLTALEAMAVGTPVVSSGHGALPEVTGECALQPDSDDVEGWSRALERIVEDGELWQRLSASGYERSQEFTWRRAAEMTAGVYRQVTG